MDGVGDIDGKRAARCGFDRPSAFVNAFASACVFPGSSLEYPVAKMTGSMSGTRATRTHPTQNAVCTGMQLSDSASFNACCIKVICSSSAVRRVLIMVDSGCREQSRHVVEGI